MLTYEDAYATAMAADQGEFTLPSYTGGAQDLNYLKEWVLGEVETIYHVSADVFDQATIYSTSILRDFVHRALYQTTDSEYLDDLIANNELQYPQRDDVAVGFRYPAYGLCDLMAWQEYQVFRAFGYKTDQIATINGDIGVGQPSSYNDSHATTEVYVTDYNKFIVQDATFNFIFEDDGIPLSFREAQSDLYGGDGTLTFDSFNVYNNYRITGQYATTVTPDIQALFYNSYLKTFLWDYGPDGTLDAYGFSLFPDWTMAHDPSSNQGGEYSGYPEAISTVLGLASSGMDWQTVAQAIRNSGHYVSGFALANDSEDILSHWITIRVATGLYLSIDLDHGTQLNGSYDQITNEATGGPAINFGADVSDFLKPAYLLDYAGNVMDGFVTDANPPPEVPDVVASHGTFDFNGDGKSDLFFLNDANFGVAIWQMDGTTVVANPQVGTMDSGAHFETAGDFNGDGKTDLLFLNDTTHAVTVWQMDGTTLAANSQIGTVNAAGGWTFETTGDFNGDGKTDLLFLNDTNHGVAIWQMDGTTVVANPQIGSVNAAAGWQFETTGDFNGDGKTDLLFLNSTTNGVAIWQMDGTTVVANPQIGSVNAAAGWQFETTGDFNGDGKTDLLFLNSTTNGVAIWQMDGTTVVANPQIGTMASGFQFETVGDFNGDGKTDLLFENTTTHQTSVWELDGTQIAVNSEVGTINASAGWHLVA